MFPWKLYMSKPQKQVIHSSKKGKKRFRQFQVLYRVIQIGCIRANAWQTIRHRTSRCVGSPSTGQSDIRHYFVTISEANKTPGTCITGIQLWLAMCAIRYNTILDQIGGTWLKMLSPSWRTPILRKHNNYFFMTGGCTISDLKPMVAVFRIGIKAVDEVKKIFTDRFLDNIDLKTSWISHSSVVILNIFYHDSRNFTLNWFGKPPPNLDFLTQAVWSQNLPQNSFW